MYANTTTIKIQDCSITTKELTMGAFDLAQYLFCELTLDPNLHINSFRYP